jgi:hypothetical protein
MPRRSGEDDKTETEGRGEGLFVCAFVGGTRTRTRSHTWANKRDLAGTE